MTASRTYILSAGKARRSTIFDRLNRLSAVNRLTHEGRDVLELPASPYSPSIVARPRPHIDHGVSDWLQLCG